MTQESPACPGCGKPLASGKYDVCFSEETCREYPLHDRACYRYSLRVTLPDPTRKDTCVFLLLNPSTADEKKPDPTVDRCTCLVHEWNSQGCTYGEIVICNLFAFRSSKQAHLRNASHPTIGPSNDQHILAAAQNAGIIVCAWGGEGSLNGRSLQVVEMLLGAGHEDKLHKFGLTSDKREPLHAKPQRRDQWPQASDLKRWERVREWLDRRKNR